MTTIIVSEDCTIYQENDVLIVNDIAVTIMPLEIQNIGDNTITVLQTTDIIDTSLGDLSINIATSTNPIIYDGNNLSITITQQSFAGLFESTFENVSSIKNVNLIGTGSLYSGYTCSWLCGSGFYGYSITNCRVDCPVSDSQGALCYENFGIMSNCTSFIRGGNSTFGGLCYKNSGTITNSYSAYFNLCISNSNLIEYCYTYASGPESGGICVINEFGGTISNCYSYGDISDGSAGICLQNDGTIINCYTSGPGVDGSGITLTNNGTITNCYAECNNNSSGWHDTNANSTIGTENWISPSPGQNYILSSFIGNQYDNVSKNLIVGIPSQAPSEMGYYSLLSGTNGVDIDIFTGTITITTAGEYNLTVLYTELIANPPQYYNYGISSFTMNVAAACFVKGTCITTDNGDIPIEKLAKNDLIKTDRGYTKIYDIIYDKIQNSQLKPLIYRVDNLYLTYNHSLLRDDKLVYAKDIGEPILDDNVYEIYNVVLSPTTIENDKVIFVLNYIIYANCLMVEAMDFISYMNRIQKSTIQIA